jgi:AcrR family transcriptional regulator
MPRNARTRMLDSTVQLLRHHGYNGTGFREVIAHSGAPRGSIYHHFPRGKAQLGTEAVTAAGEFIDALLARGVEGDDFTDGFERFWRWWIKYVEADDFQAGCPIVAVAAEAHPEAPELAAACASVFDRWAGTLADAIQQRAGIKKRDEAVGLATLIIAALEGATVMARAAGNREPLAATGRQLAALLRARLD